jgi:hypothetical protein
MPIKYKVVKDIKRKGFPTSSKLYPEAHEEASNSEKKKYPKGYKKLKKVDKNTKEGQLIGKNTKSGKIEVAKSVKPSLREEVAYHENTEHKDIARLKKGSKRRKVS